MKDKTELKKKIPPYLPYKTLINFLDSMKVAVPARIDRSILHSMSGTMQGQLIAALEYLHLINPANGVPTEKLTQLVHSEGAEKQRVLKEIITTSYSFLFKDDFDLTRVTSNQLQELFINSGTSGDTTRKSIAFFMSISKAAGLPLSPHLKKPSGRRPGTTKSKVKIKPTHIPQVSNKVSSEGPQTTTEIPWKHLLLSKFPSFDPAWPDDVKAKWFEAFKELRSMADS